MMKSNCEKSKKFSPSKLKTTYFSHQPIMDSLKEKRKIVDSLLRKSQPQPIMISYCYQPYKNKKESIIPDSNFHTAFAASHGKKDCGRHASLIIGQRKKGNKCEYLLRNPNDCIRKEILNGLYYTCEGITDKWVDTKLLLNNTYNLYSF